MGSFRIISYNYMRISNSLKKFNLRRISMIIYWKAPHILNPWIRNIAKRKSYWLFLEDAKKIIIVKTGKIRHINIHLHFLFILYLKQVKHVIRNIFSLKIYKEKEQKKNIIASSLVWNTEWNCGSMQGFWCLLRASSVQLQKNPWWVRVTTSASAAQF